MSDLTILTDAELEAEIQARLAEQDRRRVLATAETQAAELAARVYAAHGGDGQPWLQPTGAHDAHPLGARVEEGGKMYRSKTPANVWGPPSTEPRWWEEVWLNDDGEWVSQQPGGGIPEWDPLKSYFPPAAVTRNGTVYDLIHTNANPGDDPASPSMWAVWEARP